MQSIAAVSCSIITPDIAMQLAAWMLITLRVRYSTTGRPSRFARMNSASLLPLLLPCVCSSVYRLGMARAKNDIR